MARKDGQLYVSTSERITFKTCRWRWEQAYVDRLKPPVAAPALRFGVLVHKALEVYYKPGVKRGPHPARTFEKEYEQELARAGELGYRDEEGTWHAAAGLGVGMLEHYVDNYGKDDEWEVISSEQKFEYPIYSPRGNIVGVYVGVLDGVWRHRVTGRMRLVDHKTAEKISIKHLALDEQSGAYWTFGVDYLRHKKIIKPSDHFECIWFNFLRKAELDSRPRNALGQFLNQDGSVSAKQPPAYFLRHPSYRDEPDRENVRSRVASELREMKLVRAGKLDVYKNPGMFNCGGCFARDICELHETGADWLSMRDATMVPKGQWQPQEAWDWEQEH